MNCAALKASLTPGQQARLQPLEPIGAGSTACVYATPKSDTVVKLTSDPEDAYALATVKGSKAVPRIDNIFELQRPDGSRRDLWAIEVERVQPVLQRSEDGLSLDAFNTTVVTEETHKTVKGPNPKYKVPAKTKALAKQNCRDTVKGGWLAPDQLDACYRINDEAFAVYEELGKRGVAFADSHTGNWGRKNGKLVAIDLGLSNTGPVDLPKLAGARKRRGAMFGETTETDKKDDGFGFGLVLMGLAAVFFFVNTKMVEKK